METGYSSKTCSYFKRLSLPRKEAERAQRTGQVGQGMEWEEKSREREQGMAEQTGKEGQRRTAQQRRGKSEGKEGTEESGSKGTGREDNRKQRESKHKDRSGKHQQGSRETTQGGEGSEERGKAHGVNTDPKGSPGRGPCNQCLCQETGKAPGNQAKCPFGGARKTTAQCQDYNESRAGD